MKPRSLRHRLEKSAKLLVIIQKHLPDIDCLFDAEKSDDGSLIVDFENNSGAISKMPQLGKDLESKGYRFTEKKSPWLGHTIYQGKADGKPTIMLKRPISKDRLVINESLPEKPYSFSQS